MLFDEDDTQRYRRMFGRYPTGVAVCLAGDGALPDGMTINSLTSVSLEPQLLSFCARKGSRTARRVRETEKFSINLLTVRQETVSQHFSGTYAENIHKYLIRRQGFWCVDEANASFLCHLTHSIALGDHDMLVGQVIRTYGLMRALSPLMYFQGRYAPPLRGDS